MRLSDDELREVLERAEEIQRTSRKGDDWNAEVAAADVVSASEKDAHIRYLRGVRKW
jgi:hypothetical protein